MSDHNGLNILCLDGGDARCMSQLYILQEYMHRLEYKMGKSILPCDHFDLIAAVDSSSLIAVLLGPFRMSLEEAQEAFHDVYTAVFSNENDSPETRALNLGKEIMRLMKSRGIPETKLISEFDLSKVALCYSNTTRLDSCKFFRTYQSPQQITQNVTILEALQATLATPGVLLPVSIGKKGRQETAMSAINGFGNPIREVIKEAYHVFGTDAHVSCLLSLGSGFRGSVSFSDGKAMMQGAAVDCDRVAREVNRGLVRFNVYHRFSVDHGLEGWGSFQASFEVVKSHVDEYLGRDETDGQLDRCVLAAVKDGDVSMQQIYGVKAQGTRSGHGLPPLSAYFVMRRKPMNEIVKGLVEGDSSTQRTMVVSGLGGSGKTQLALKFARDFQENYQYVLFIDASSADSIEKGLVSRVRSMRTGHSPNTYEEALEIFSNPDQESDKDWFIIFDNADDAGIHLSDYIPLCEHGSILITTRNPALCNIAPNSHLELGSMDEDEAVEVLLSSAFPAGKVETALSLSQTTSTTSVPTSRDREAATIIANELGCLPIVVVQAGCYIQQHRALHNYLDRLKSNRLDLLKRSTLVHRDKLKYSHGVYASFDIVLQAISTQAVKLLGLLSFFHFSNFPKTLFAIAADSKFAHEYIELLDRPPEFGESIQFLIDILCPDGNWNETVLDGLLEELQQYSLVTLIPIHNVVLLRFHPLVHSWAQDRLDAKEQVAHRAAALRLFICGVTKDDDDEFHEYLQPHLKSFSPSISGLHVNDQAAILKLLQKKGDVDFNLKAWIHVHEVVEKQYGRNHIRTTRALQGLAGAYADSGDWVTTEALAINESLVGRDHPETGNALENLSGTLESKDSYQEAEEMQKEVLRARIKVLGLRHRDTARSMMNLADTYYTASRYQDAQRLLEGVIAIRTEVIGRAAASTLYSIEYLSVCLYYSGQIAEAEKLTKDLILLRQRLHGEQHLKTVASMSSLAVQYENQGQYQEAEELRRVEIESRKRMQGEHHEDVLDAIASLAKSCFNLKRYDEAERLWREELAGRQETQGNTHNNTLIAMGWLAESCFELKRYDEAETLWREKFAGLQETKGDTFNTVTRLGRMCFELKRYEEAEQLYRTALSGHQPTQGNNTSNTRYPTYWLARSCFYIKKYDEAERLYREVLEGIRTTQGNYHPETLSMMAYLAELYLECSRHEEAEQLQKEALATARTIPGDYNIKFLYAIGGMARSFYDVKKYKEAEQLWREELAGHRALHAENHSHILDTLGWVARSCLELGQHEEAEKLWKEELAGRRTTQGDTHADTLRAMGWLGVAYYELKRYQEAEKLYREKLTIQRATRGDTHLDTLQVLYRLAELCFEVKRYEEAERFWREELAGRREIQGNTHVRTVVTAGWLGDSCFELKKYEEAEHLLKEALAGYRATYGDTHKWTLSIISKLAELHFALKQYGEAEKLRREALASLRETEGDTHLDTLMSIYKLAKFCFDLKRYQEAEQLWREELAGRRATQGDTHTDTLDTIYWIARACLELNKYEDSREMLDGVLKDQRATKGNSHEDTLDTIYYLARGHMGLGKYEDAEQLLKERLDALNSDHGEAQEPHQIHFKLARTFHVLAQVYISTLRHSEATKSVNEAIRLRRENLEADDPDLLESLALRDSIINDTHGGIYNIQISLDQQDLTGASPEDLSAPDPGGDPTYSPPPPETTLGLASVRTQSPFSLRTTFVNRPNSWSMF